jgi:pimeloyl-ACP methyl ester carboxylesterase
MAQDRVPVKLDVDGVTITAQCAGASTDGRPLIAALHGGTYTGRYFDVAGSAQGSFMDLAAAAGYQVVSFDRPGYGGSSALAPADNTFARHAELLAPAIARVAGDTPVFLVGHSIGGMIALMIAGAAHDFRLVGASVTGMGAVIRRGGAADALASLPPDETIDLPYDQRDMVMFGPAGSFTADGVEQAHGSYAPTPVRELIAAPQWAEEILPGLAPRITVPVHNALAEFDALWDSTPANVATFATMLTGAPFVDAAIARGTGHSIDHHLLGHALHLRQLAFAEECTWWAAQDRA